MKRERLDGALFFGEAGRGGGATTLSTWFWRSIFLRLFTALSARGGSCRKRFRELDSSVLVMWAHALLCLRAQKLRKGQTCAPPNTRMKKFGTAGDEIVSTHTRPWSSVLPLSLVENPFPLASGESTKINHKILGRKGLAGGRAQVAESQPWPQPSMAGLVDDHAEHDIFGTNSETS